LYKFIYLLNFFLLYIYIYIYIPGSTADITGISSFGSSDWILLISLSSYKFSDLSSFIETSSIEILIFLSDSCPSSSLFSFPSTLSLSSSISSTFVELSMVKSNDSISGKFKSVLSKIFSVSSPLSNEISTK